MTTYELTACTCGALIPDTDSVCGCCGVAKAVAFDERGRELGVGFCLACMAHSEPYAKCGACGEPLTYLERMGAAANQTKIIGDCCKGK